MTIGYKAGLCIFYEEIGGKESLNVILTPKDVTCFNGNEGKVYVEVNGGTAPFSYLWNTGSTSPSLHNLVAGAYTVSVTDSRGKTAEGSVEIKEPESQLFIEATVTNASCNAGDGSAMISISGGHSPYNVIWSNGSTAQNLSGAIAGTYIITVTDDAGCSVSKSVQIGENSTLDASLTPNYLECYQEGQGEVVDTISGGTEPYW